MTQPETWALADSQFTTLPWSPAHAAKAFHPSALPRLIDAHEAALRPVSSDWLQKRLRLLWKSSVVNGSLDATAWLHETGRLLADIPQDILSDAIDRCVKESDRGFMPTVGQIRAVADPKFRLREMHARRLAAIRDNDAADPKPAAEQASPAPEIAESTADMLKRLWPTMSKHEPGSRDRDDAATLNPDRECKSPNREDYIRLFGVDPEAPQPSAEAA
jgi:hypothetical protein